MGFTVDIKGNASHLDKTLKGVEKSLSNLGSVATTGLKSLAGIGVAGGAAIAAFIVSSSNAASNIEMLTMQFETLLGGADAAGKRMEEIVKFAASTPFEIPELAATSKLLQTMGGTLLATGDGLRMVGDASAIVGKPLEEIGLHIGRVFAAMTSGTSAGESVGRLLELGLITGDVKRELEALAAAQKKGTVEVLTSEKALAKLKGILSANEGAMARLAATTRGKLSNMKDNLSKLQVAFGTGFNEGLKDALDATNTFLPQLETKFRSAGDVVGKALSEGVRGNTEELGLIGGFIGDVIWAGFKAIWLKGMDSLIVNPVSNVVSNPLMTPRVIANVIGIQGIDMPDFGNFTQSNPLSSYIQSGIEEGAGSGSLKKLLELQKARQERDNKNFMKEYEESNKWLEGIYKNQSIVGAKFSN
jgi:hypothetical protein